MWRRVYIRVGKSLLVILPNLLLLVDLDAVKYFLKSCLLQHKQYVKVVPTLIFLLESKSDLDRDHFKFI